MLTNLLLLTFLDVTQIQNPLVYKLYSITTSGNINCLCIRLELVISSYIQSHKHETSRQFNHQYQ
jgi:hypothetical protein